MADRLPMGFDLDMIPVPKEDTRPFGTRLWDFLAGGGPWGTAQPGQRGTWVPSRVNEQGQPELAAPEMALNAADVIQNLPRVGFSEIMRDPDGNRDLIRRLAEGSFDFASMLPAAGVAAGRVTAGSRPKEIGPLYRGSSGKLADADPQREFYWTTPDRDVASSYAEETLSSATATPRVQEVFAKFSNPKTIDAKGASYHAIDTDSLVRAAAESGHDGVVFNNLVDPPTIAGIPPDQLVPSTTVAAIKRGTMFDRWGNQVFSNPDDLNTSAILALMTQQQGAHPQQ